MEDTTEFWKRHIAAIGQEGVAVTVYAKRHGLSLASLYYWRQKLMAADGVAGYSAIGKFVALRIADTAPSSGACTLVLPSGLRLEMSALPAPPGWRRWSIRMREHADASRLPHRPGLSVPRSS